jgi:S-DNA-T family DNA segregation ATPase FtsK/SpoIIIE
MAKRKSTIRKERKELNHRLALIALGLILVFISILGIGFGMVGLEVKKAAMYIFGELWFLMSFLLLYAGLSLIIKGKVTVDMSERFFGILLVVLVLLTIMHYKFIMNTDPGQIVNETLAGLKARTGSMTINSTILSTGDTSFSIGGGLIGAFISFIFTKLFGKVGIIISSIFFLIFAAILLFDIDLGEMLVSLKEKVFTKKEKDDDDDEEGEEEYNIPTVSNIPKEIPQREETIASVAEEVKQDLPPYTGAVSSTSSYQMPDINRVLDEPQAKKQTNQDFTKNNRVILERVLADFQIQGKVVDIHVGPAVTQYEVAVPNGTKLSKILSINKEIALALASKDVRIEAPIPGKSTVGIELANPNISAVKIKEILGHIPSDKIKSKILVSLGKDLMGRVQVADIAKMPHLLVAGSTGSGKSVCINSFIASILLRYRPDEVKLVLVDPKKVELSNYNGIPHLLWPVVTDPKQANLALKKVVAMMEDRYEKFSEAGAKNIESYNEIAARKGWDKMFYLVTIIDELADLMLVASKEVEDSIMRITQMARAAGIHLIVATQRPSTDVITGVVKANIPSRISFAVASQIDSRTILDQGGAEKLLGKGDMLYLPMGENNPIRIQGCFITDDEIARLIDAVKPKDGTKVVYDTSLEEAMAGGSDSGSGGESGGDDPMYNEILDFAVQTGKISASLIQRRFRLGYNRAARIIDIMEERGVVGPQNGSKPREVLIKKGDE